MASPLMKCNMRCTCSYFNHSCYLGFKPDYTFCVFLRVEKTFWGRPLHPTKSAPPPLVFERVYWLVLLNFSQNLFKKSTNVKITIISNVMLKYVLYGRKLSYLVYETVYNLGLKINIPMFVDFLESQKAKGEGQLVSKDTRIPGVLMVMLMMWLTLVIMMILVKQLRMIFFVTWLS